MSTSSDPFDLYNRLAQGVANGLNRAAEITLADIKGHVQIRTGRLEQTYAIIQRATPDNWEVRIDSPQLYKQWQYPHHIPQRIPPDRNRALQGNPLFDGDPQVQKFRAAVEPVVEVEVRKSLGG